MIEREEGRDVREREGEMIKYLRMRGRDDKVPEEDEGERDDKSTRERERG